MIKFKIEGNWAISPIAFMKREIYEKI